LRPIKAVDLIPSVASELGISEEHAKLIINEYWSSVRESVSRLKHLTVHVEDLGDFEIKHWKLEKKIQSYSNLPPFEWAKRDYKALVDLKTFYEEEKQRKEFIKTYKESLNENIQDSTGSVELPIQED
jgi:nucleoid DNA-binding protein